MWMGQQTDRVKSPLANQEPLFRIHVGGDFVDQENLDRWLGIAVRFPIIKFMAFTKKYELLPPLSSLPVNIKVFTSIWPGIELPTGLAQTYPKAWLMEDPRLPEVRNISVLVGVLIAVGIVGMKTRTQFSLNINGGGYFE